MNTRDASYQVSCFVHNLNDLPILMPSFMFCSQFKRFTDFDGLITCTITAVKKKTYIIPDAPALRNILNPHLTGFLRLNCRILLLFVFERMICESLDMTFCCSTFRQFARTISNNGRILNSLSCLF